MNERCEHSEYLKIWEYESAIKQYFGYCYNCHDWILFVGVSETHYYNYGPWWFDVKSDIAITHGQYTKQLYETMRRMEKKYTE
jgi:hypothetical protein